MQALSPSIELANGEIVLVFLVGCDGLAADFFERSLVKVGESRIAVHLNIDFRDVETVREGEGVFIDRTAARDENLVLAGHCR